MRWLFHDPGRAAEVERRERRAESRAFQAEFDEFMQSLETAEAQNDDPRLSKITGR